MSKPGWKHYEAAQHMLSYLSGTLDLGITYSRDVIVDFMLMPIRISVQMKLERIVLVMNLYLRMGQYVGSVVLIKKLLFLHVRQK